MEITKIKRLKQLLNEYIFENKVNLSKPISRVYSDLSEEYTRLKLIKRRKE